MALVRCGNCGRPKGRTRKYIRAVEPLNYPNHAIICGRTGCNELGKIWLEAYEWKNYQNGTRIFEIMFENTVKIKVK